MTRLYKILSFLPFLFLFLAFYFLHKQLQLVDFHQFYQQLKLWKVRQIEEAIGCVALSFAVLIAYDFLALRGLKLKVPIPRVIVTAFSAFSISNIVGHSLLSGSSIRFISYSKSGATLGHIAQIGVRNSLNFWMGYACLLSYGLLSFTDSLGQLPDYFSLWARPAAIVLIALVGGIFLLSFLLKGREWQIRSLTFSLPRVQEAFIGTVLGSIDLLMCALTLYFILPSDASINFGNFLCLYLVAQVIGLVSQVPGGIGITDGLLLEFLDDYTTIDKLLVSILLFRIFYYALPLALTLLTNLGVSFWANRRRLTRTAANSRNLIEPIIAPILSIITAFCGLILVMSGIVPSIETRVQNLSRWIVFPIIEISHLVGSLVGFCLLLLSHKIWRKNQSAYRLLLWLVLAGVVASLLKGFDWEEATILFLFGIFLLPFRAVFYRNAPLRSHYGFRFDLLIALILSIAIYLGLFVYSKVPYSHDLWLTFGMNADASRFLRSMAALWGLFVTFVVYDGMRKKSPSLTPPLFQESEILALLDILSMIEDTTASLVLLGDKYVRFSANRKAFLMFAPQNQSWVVLGDIYGEDKACGELLQSFLTEADRSDARVVFYECRESFVPKLLEAGMQIVKFGEEALIPLGSFGLEGNSRKSLRASYNRGGKEGLTFRILGKHELDAAFSQLKLISDAWLHEKNASEKGFSLGIYDEDYLRYFPCAIVEHEGAIVAFANIIGGNGRELSIDLMRHDSARAPKATMDYLFISILLWGKERAFESFNLGMAPLSGIQAKPWAPLWHGIAQKTFDKGEHFYNFRGLREYKEKFDPIWRSRFVAFDSSALMIQTMFDLALLIGGGWINLVRKRGNR